MITSLPFFPQKNGAKHRCLRCVLHRSTLRSSCRVPGAKRVSDPERRGFEPPVFHSCWGFRLRRAHRRGQTLACSPASTPKPPWSGTATLAMARSPWTKQTVCWPVWLQPRSIATPRTGGGYRQPPNTIGCAYPCGPARPWPTVHLHRHSTIPSHTILVRWCSACIWCILMSWSFSSYASKNCCAQCHPQLACG